MKKPRIVVHLGNVDFAGSRPQAVKTKKYARRFGHHLFIGIDTAPYMGRRGRECERPKHLEEIFGALDRHESTKGRWSLIEPNWAQVNGGSKTLEALPDESVHLISSELSLGHYTDEGMQGGVLPDGAPQGKVDENTDATLRTAYRKLVPGGSVQFAVSEEMHGPAKKVLDGTPFKGNYTSRPLTEREYGRTHWTRELASKSKVHQIIARKPKK